MSENTETRTANDPRITEIMTALDRAEKIGWLGTIASSIVDEWANCPERWAFTDNGWTGEGIRAFVLAYLLNCPESDLIDALVIARRKIAFAETEIEAEWVALGKKLRTTTPEINAALLVVLRHAVAGTSPTPGEMDEIDHMLGERMPEWRTLLGTEVAA